MAENKKNIDNSIDEMDELLTQNIEDESEIDVENELEIKGDNSAVLSDLHAYLQQVGQHELMTPDEEAALFSKMDSLPDGDEKLALRNEIFTRNLRLVVSIAKKYFPSCQSMTPMDIIMEGNIGLLTAIRRFDVTKGYKFSTYATWWIRQSILRGIYNKENLIRLPVHIQEKDFKIRRELRKCELEGMPAPDKFSDYFARNNLVNLSSLDKPIVSDTAHDEDACLMDIIADERTTEDLYFNIALQDVINDILNDYSAGKPCFSDREKEIIIRRFGLNGNSPETLETIGNSLGVSRERIRQIESKAIKKFRLKKNKVKLKEFYRT